MPTQKLTQNNFTSGQYDRAVQGKEQSELVANGLAKAMNVVSSESGELRKRLGTKFLMELDENAVVVPFRSPSGDDIMLLCTDKKIKAYEFAGDGLKPFLTPDENAPTFPTSGWNTNTNGEYTVKLSSKTAPSEWGNGFNLSASPYYGKGSLFKIENTVQNIPAYIEIDSTETQILGSLWVRWVNSCNGDYKGHYKGWIDPVLQYSDDGESWVSVETDYTNLTEKINKQNIDIDNSLQSNKTTIQEMLLKLQSNANTLDKSMDDIDKRIKDFVEQTKVFTRADELKSALQKDISEIKDEIFSDIVPIESALVIDDIDKGIIKFG